MAIPGVGQKFVRAQTAIFAGALLHDRGSDRGRLRGADLRRAIECLIIPGVARSIVRQVYLWRTSKYPVVVAGELQCLMHPLAATGRASEKIRVPWALAVEGFDDLLGTYGHQIRRSRAEVDLLFGMTGQHAATKRISRRRRCTHVGIG